jgi:hypothetical protein
MDKLRALQKRYGQTAAKPGLSASHALLSTSSAADSTSSLASLTTATATASAKPGLSSAGGGASIQDLRVRLSTVLRSGDASSSSSDLGCAAPVARGPSAASTTTSSSSATDAVQALKERLARIKHTAATSASS